MVKILPLVRLSSHPKLSIESDRRGEWQEFVESAACWRGTLWTEMEDISSVCQNEREALSMRMNQDPSDGEKSYGLYVHGAVVGVTVFRSNTECTTNTDPMTEMRRE